MIIFGAGVVGKALYCACQDKGIKIDSFFDQNPNKNTMCGLPVLHYLQKDHYIISVADIDDAVDYLDSAEYSDCVELLKDFDPTQYPFEESLDFVKYAIDTAITCHDYYKREGVFLRSVDLIITERCSLKCKDCSNLMQYYEHPKDCDTKVIMRDIETLFEQVDEVNEIRVIGGEPFMNKDWPIIVWRLINEPKLHRIVIYTNGTILPNIKVDMPQSDKILVLITDYGELSNKITRLKWELIKYGIPYYVNPCNAWIACSDIIQHNRTPEENHKLFKSCTVRNLKTLSNGIMHKCPFDANLARLGYKFADACDYCNSRPFGAPEITPAIQR
jgi:hypothetical protein